MFVILQINAHEKVLMIQRASKRRLNDWGFIGPNGIFPQETQGCSLVVLHSLSAVVFKEDDFSLTYVQIKRQIILLNQLISWPSERL